MPVLLIGGVLMLGGNTERPAGGPSVSPSTGREPRSHSRQHAPQRTITPTLVGQETTVPSTKARPTGTPGPTASPQPAPAECPPGLRKKGCAHGPHGR